MIRSLEFDTGEPLAQSAFVRLGKAVADLSFFSQVARLDVIRMRQEYMDQSLIKLEREILDKKIGLEVGLEFKITLLKDALVLAALGMGAENQNLAFTFEFVGNVGCLKKYGHEHITNKVGLLMERYGAEAGHKSMIEDAEILYAGVKEARFGSIYDEPNPTLPIAA